MIKDYEKSKTGQIIQKRFKENKSYRTIGKEMGISYTSVMTAVHKHYEDYPELKPVKQIKKIKLSLKGRSKNSENGTSEKASILVDGYAARIAERFTNCGNPDCNKCRRDSEGKYIGHGPYSYLYYRNSSGQIISKYLSKAKKQEILTALAQGQKPIQIKTKQ